MICNVYFLLIKMFIISFYFAIPTINIVSIERLTIVAITYVYTKVSSHWEIIEQIYGNWYPQFSN